MASPSADFSENYLCFDLLNVCGIAPGVPKTITVDKAHMLRYFSGVRIKAKMNFFILAPHQNDGIEVVQQ